MKDEWYGQLCLPSRPSRTRLAGTGGKAEYQCDLNWGVGPLPESRDEGKSRPYTRGGRGGIARMRCIHQRCIRMRWNHEWEIMGRTLRAGPSVGHPFHCETTTLRTVPVANSSEWTRTWSSCVAHSTKAARNVPGGFPSIHSLPGWRNSLDIFDEFHSAELDCQGERGRARNNSQKKKIYIITIIILRLYVSIHWPPLPVV